MQTVEYAPGHTIANRYSAADDPETLAVAADVAARIAAVPGATASQSRSFA